MDFKGHSVRLFSEVPIVNGQMVEFRFLGRKGSIEQGIEFEVDRGKGKVEVPEIGKERFAHPVFWTHTAPQRVRLICHTRRERGAVGFWNIWRYPGTDGIESRMGNAGMYVEKTSPDVYVLHCSNGIGEVDFEDLVVEVKILKPESVTMG